MKEQDYWLDKNWRSLKYRINKLYAECASELQSQAEDFFTQFGEDDFRMRQAVDAGQMTEKEYRSWLQLKIMQGERYISLRDECAKRMHNYNMTAYGYINDDVVGVFRDAANFTAYGFELNHSSISFALIHEDAVRRLILEQPELLPKVTLDGRADIRWNQKKITNIVTKGIIEGNSIPTMAGNLSRNLTGMNQASATRTARTAVTGAHNGGRMYTADKLAKSGVHVTKRWLATKDRRTRHSHGMLDGKTIGMNELFVSELGSKLAYPCDLAHGALGADIYNCRCAMQIIDSLDTEPREVSVRNPTTGRWEYKTDWDYRTWLRWKESME